MDDREHQAERNCKAFKKLLPEISEGRLGKLALVRNGEIVEFFDTPGDALKSGRLLYEDETFSTQEITNRVVDLGFHSHVANLASTRPWRWALGSNGSNAPRRRQQNIGYQSAEATPTCLISC